METTQERRNNTQFSQPLLPTYEEDLAFANHFFLNFLDSKNEMKYMLILAKLANREIRRLDVWMNDLEQYFDREVPAQATFLNNVATNTLRYLEVFARAADECMDAPTISPDELAAKEDVFDVLSRQREQQMARNDTNPEEATAKEGARRVPASLLRRYDVYIRFEPEHPVTHALRKVSGQDVGNLIKIKGVVTHVTDVKPLARVVTYTTRDGYEVYQEVLGRSFVPLSEPDSRDKGLKAFKWSEVPVMQTRGSKFSRYQEARIQEVADEVPEGATPRTIAVHLRGDVTRTIKAGDMVNITGIFLPEPFTGFRAMRAGLLTSTYLEVMDVQQIKESYTSFEITEEMEQAIVNLQRDGDIYKRLAGSIAPEIFGHEDVKKALLLQMVGGVTKHFDDGLRLRGDIHICLMGDPGVAKSQLLKHISRLAPRAVYTTGKGSSGVGLTAAVLRNTVTKELVLEGGALVLADNGVCCIDEFDKMEEGDRTAIHEVMEQQTVSIAKAGITTTLNTRTTILAAANPQWGRWDKRRTPQENMNMPAALLSRFDLLWCILDTVDENNDKLLAQHVLEVHRTLRVPAPDSSSRAEPVTPELLKAYISKAKRIKPVVPRELTSYITSHYVSMRADEAEREQLTGEYTTPRTLMSILRLSQAVAKLRFDTTVCQHDVDEALALMRLSKNSLESNGQERPRQEDPVSRVYHVMRDYAMLHRQQELSWATIREELDRKNVRVSEDVIIQTIMDYSNIAVLQVIMRDGNIAAVVFPLEDIY